MHNFSHYIFPSHGTLPDRIQLFDCKSRNISVPDTAFDKRIFSTAIISIFDMKFGQAETPCKTGALLRSRDRLEGLPAFLINKANSPRLDCGGAAKELWHVSRSEIALTKRSGCR